MKLWKNFSNFITSQDVFADPILFTLNKHDSPKTVMGGFLSTILLIFIAIQFISQVRYTLFNENPTISSFTVNKQKRGDLNITSDSLPIAVKMTDLNGNIYHNDLFVSAVQNSIIFQDGIMYPDPKLLPLVDCSFDNFPHLTKEEFDYFKLNDFLCLKNPNVTISGYINERKFSSLNFRVSFCPPKELDKNCNPEVRRQFFREKCKEKYLFFELTFHNNVINAFNHSNPVVKYIEAIGIHMDPDKYKFSQVFLNKQNLISDDGLIWQNETKYNIVSYEGFTNEFASAPYTRDSTIIDINIFPSNTEFIFRRGYNKLQSDMADIMALYEYIKFAIKIICAPFGITKKNIKLMNTLFQFDFEGQKKELNNSKLNSQNDKRTNKIEFDKKIRKKDSEFKNFKDEHKLKSSYKIKIDTLHINGDNYENNNQSNSIESKNLKINGGIKVENSNSNLGNTTELINLKITKSASLNDNINKELHGNKTIGNEPSNLEIIKPNKKELFDFWENRKHIRKKNELHFSFLQILAKNFLCCVMNKKLKQKYKLYKKAEEKLQQVMEISYVMNKLEEVEKLKTIMMNTNQIALLNMSSKEVCSLNNEKMRNSEYNRIKYFQTDHKLFNTAIHKIIKNFVDDKRKKNKIEKRLIELLPDELKRNFEK
jgi:hypothetical protein